MTPESAGVAPTPTRPPLPRIIVTRPAPVAHDWARAIVARGYEALALPLIQIEPLADQSAVHAARARMNEYVGVMFVSANAANHFFVENSPLSLYSTGNVAITTRAWATGPGTRKALEDRAVPAHLIDAPTIDAGQFDSEALWDLVRPQVTPGSRVLVVRGTASAADPASAGASGAGRDWFATAATQAGAQVDFVVAYRRCAPTLAASERAQALAAAQDRSVWLFSSAEALANLKLCLPDCNWQRARALATHPRIAQAAHKMGFAEVTLSRPVLDEVLASIESIA